MPNIANQNSSSDTGTSAWAVYQPSDEAPWDLRRGVHLHRRAGFAATWTEIQRDLNDGPQIAVERLLQGRSRSQGVPENFDEMAEVIGTAAVDAGDLRRLQAWWMFRMLMTPD